MNQYAQQHVRDPKVRFLLPLFYLWTFVFLSRPQDFLTFIAQVRPVLVLEVLTLSVFLGSASRLMPRVSFNSAQVKLFLALICIMVVGVPFAFYRKQALMFLLTDYLNVVLFFLLFFIVINSIEAVKTVLRIVCIGAAAYTLFALAQGKMLQDRLTVGGMFDPNDLSFFIVSFLPYNFLFLGREHPFPMKIVSFLNLGFGSLAVLMTGSRGGFVALLCVFMFTLLSRTRAVKLSYKVLFVTLCLALVVFKSNTIDFGRLGTVFAPQNDYNLTDEFGRKEIWKRGLTLMTTYPLTGVGVSCFDMAIGMGRQEEGKIPKWQTAHNSFVQIGAETGIVGFILFILLNLNAYRIFSAATRKGRSEELIRVAEMARVGFVGHLICAMFLSQAYSAYFAFYVVLSSVLKRTLENESVFRIPEND
jgi:O-antigen ligase